MPKNLRLSSNRCIGLCDERIADLCNLVLHGRHLVLVRIALPPET